MLSWLLREGGLAHVSPSTAAVAAAGAVAVAVAGAVVVAAAAAVAVAVAVRAALLFFEVSGIAGSMCSLCP